MTLEKLETWPQRGNESLGLARFGIVAICIGSSNQYLKVAGCDATLLGFQSGLVAAKKD